MYLKIKKTILNKKRPYVRDKRSPVPKSEGVSRVMSANKGKHTGPELILRKALRKEGLIGYRLHPKKVLGRPDIVFLKERIAIFVHGCFWHRCSKCKMRLPKTNKTFWVTKFKKNKERDERKESSLKKEGWRVVTVWECDIEKRPISQVKKIKRALSTSSQDGI